MSKACSTFFSARMIIITAVYDLFSFCSLFPCTQKRDEKGSGKYREVGSALKQKVCLLLLPAAFCLSPEGIKDVKSPYFGALPALPFSVFSGALAGVAVPGEGRERNRRCSHLASHAF